MENHLVSVIIPTYNRANELKRCLNSIVNQTYKKLEVIICDDGSTDNTEEIIEIFKPKLNLVYIRDDNFGGPAKPRNNGIINSKGEILAFLDSDDWWYPEKLSLSIKYLYDYDIVYHNLDIHSFEKFKKGTVSGRNLTNNIFKDLLINGNGIPNSSVVIKKSIVDKTGFFTEDKNLIAVEDLDYWLRVSEHTIRFKFLNKNLGAYWIGENISISENQLEKEDYIFKKYQHILSNEEIIIAENVRSFRKARILHQINKFSEARIEYKKSLNQLKIANKIKSLIGYIASLLKIKI